MFTYLRPAEQYLPRTICTTISNIFRHVSLHYSETSNMWTPQEWAKVFTLGSVNTAEVLRQSIRNKWNFFYLNFKLHTYVTGFLFFQFLISVKYRLNFAHNILFYNSEKIKQCYLMHNKYSQVYIFWEVLVIASVALPWQLTTIRYGNQAHLSQWCTGPT